jgi:hypothetical protein
MSRCKLSFAKSRSVADPACGTGASETGDPPEGWGVQALRGQIPRNEAYIIEVRRSASGPEGLRPGGTRDKGNEADGRFPTASKGFRAPYPKGRK